MTVKSVEDTTRRIKIQEKEDSKGKEGHTSQKKNA